MNAFVRRLVVMCVLWSACELVLPQGKQQLLVRMTASVLVMIALLSSAGEWISGGLKQPVWSMRIAGAGEKNYQRTALTALANQVESFCVRQAQRAGYQAEAAVWLKMDGQLEKIRLLLRPTETTLLSKEEVCCHLAQRLEVDRNCILLEEP